MVLYAGSPMLMTLTRSSVKVTRLQNFRKLHFSNSISPANLQRSSKLMVDRGSTGPDLQLVGAGFLNFSSRWQSRDFEVCEMLISPENPLGLISALPEARSL